MAREQNDRQASVADVARLAGVAESVLTSVLRQLQDVAGASGSPFACDFFEVELTCFLCLSSNGRKPGRRSSVFGFLLIGECKTVFSDPLNSSKEFL